MADTGEPLQELEAWKTKAEQAADERDQLMLEKLKASETKELVQQEVQDLTKGKDQCKDEFDVKVAQLQDQILQLGQRRQDLGDELKSRQAVLKERRVKMAELSRRFKIIAKIPRANINFKSRRQEEATDGSRPIRAVFAVSERPSMLLQDQQALITFEDEEAASRVVKMSRCPVSTGSPPLVVKPRKVSTMPAATFEVHLDTCRRTLKVSNIHSRLPEERIRDRLELSFSRPSRGGGEVESLEYQKNLGTGQVTFLQPGVSEALAMEGSYTVDLESAVRVDVGPSCKQQLHKFQVLNCCAERTVLLTDVDDGTGDVEEMQDQLEIHFQRPSNGGEIENIVCVPPGEALQAVFLREAMDVEEK